MEGSTTCSLQQNLGKMRNSSTFTYSQKIGGASKYLTPNSQWHRNFVTNVLLLCSILPFTWNEGNTSYQPKIHNHATKIVWGRGKSWKQKPAITKFKGTSPSEWRLESTCQHKERLLSQTVAQGFRNKRKKAKVLVTGNQTLLLGLRDDRRRQATLHPRLLRSATTP